MLQAYLFANSDGLKKYRPTKTANEKVIFHPGNALYRARFVQTEILPGAGHDRDANIALWSADGGKPLRGALDKAVDELTRQLAADIQSDLRPRHGSRSLAGDVPGEGSHRPRHAPDGARPARVRAGRLCGACVGKPPGRRRASRR